MLSPPTLEPRCPLHLPPSPPTYGMTVELGDAVSPGVLLQDSFALSWPRVGTWLCTHHPSLALPGGVQWQTDRQAGSCRVLEQIPRLSTRRRGCSVRLALRHLWLWWKLLPCAQTVPAGCEGQSCLSTPAAPAFLWEVGSSPSTRASTVYANVSYHLRLTGKTGETSV